MKVAEEAFTDSSVIFNYILDQDPRPTIEYFHVHESRKIAGSYVREEVYSAKKRRVAFFEWLSTQGEIKPTSVVDYTDHLSTNDEGYIRDLLYDIDKRFDSFRDKVEAIQNEITRLDAGIDEMFENDDPRIDEVVTYSISDKLKRSINGIINHRHDSKIVTNAAHWSADEATGIFVHCDEDDLTGNEEDTGTEQSEGLPDTLEGLLENSEEPPKLMNRKIKRELGEEARLEFHTLQSFIANYS